jgi:hypothetical protein
LAGAGWRAEALPGVGCAGESSCPHAIAAANITTAQIHDDFLMPIAILVLSNKKLRFLPVGLWSFNTIAGPADWSS